MIAVDGTLCLQSSAEIERGNDQKHDNNDGDSDKVSIQVCIYKSQRG